MIKKNFVFNLIYTLLNILFPVITFSYVSRLLGPAGIGKAQFIISVTQYFALAAALGIPFYGVREVARLRDNKQKLSKFVSEILIIHFSTSIFIFIAFLGIVTSAQFFQQDLTGYLIAGVYILLGFSTIDWYYSGVEQFGFIALRSFVIKLISLVLVFVLVKTRTDYYNYLGILIFSYIGGNIWNLIDVLKRIDFTTESLQFKKHFRPLMFIFGTSIAISLYQVFDTIILGLLSNETAVGLYTAAVKISKISLPLVISLGAVLIPRISVHLNDNNALEFKKLVDKSFDFILTFSLPICIGILLLSKELLFVFSGQEFLEAATAMQVVSFLTLIIGLSNLFGLQILTSAQKDKQVFISVIAGVVSSITINVLLIPKLDYLGAAIATIVSEAIVTYIAFYYARKYYQLTFNPGLVVRSLISSSLFVIVIFAIRSVTSNSYLILVTAIPLCALVYFFMQLVIFKNSILILIQDAIFKKLFHKQII